MNSRLEALIKRGYPEDIVIRLATFTDEELEYASKCAFDHISRNCSSVENPNAIFIGGQPGCGKTVMSMKLKNEIENAVEIGIDNYRMYHPRYLEIEKCIRKHWQNREESINDTPGNDVADFTHYFAGAMTDRLIELGKEKNYNLLLEWGMREPSGPLKSMEDLKNNYYKNIVLFVSSHKDISYNACNLRSEIMKNSGRIIRKVPKNFHDHCVETLPLSINKIYEEGYKRKIIDYMAIVSRNNNILWDYKSKELPGDVFEKHLNEKENLDLGNDRNIATTTTLNEMIGLKNKIINQEVVYLDPQIFNINLKSK